MKADPGRQRGGIAKNVGIALAGIAIFIAAVVGGLTYYGAKHAARDFVETQAENENKDKGQWLAENFVRFEGARADGTTLVRRFAIVDHWREGIDEELLAELPANATVQTVAETIMRMSAADGVCEDFAAFQNIEMGIANEFVDERGNVLVRTEQHASEC